MNTKLSKFPLSVIAALLLFPLLGSAQIIQFGGFESHKTNSDDGNNGRDWTDYNARWQSNIGADQVIQWNGVNSVGGSSGASGNLNENGVGATLTSLGTENIVLTTRAVGVTSAGASGAQTFSTGSPNILGVEGLPNSGPGDVSRDAGKFDSVEGEFWTFDFSKDVYLNKFMGTNFANFEVLAIDIGNNATNDYVIQGNGFTTGLGTPSNCRF